MRSTAIAVFDDVHAFAKGVARPDRPFETGMFRLRVKASCASNSTTARGSEQLEGLDGGSARWFPRPVSPAADLPG